MTIYFDFEDLAGSIESLRQADILFLLHPPQSSSANTYFRPLIQACRNTHVKHIIVLSVQGAEQAPFTPHAKIEKLIELAVYPTHLSGLLILCRICRLLYRKTLRKITTYFFPHQRPKFNWIDVKDMGMAIARILDQPTMHRKRVYTITGKENLPFSQAVAYLTETLGRKIAYISPSIIRF